MFAKKLKGLKVFLLAGLAAAAFLFAACDMTYVGDDGDSFVMQGRGGNIAADPSMRYLAIYNLPDNFSFYNIADVFVHNQKGQVAQCADYARIGVSVNDSGAAAYVPLVFSGLDEAFTETGFYYVSFDINVDVDTRYLVAAEDRVRVLFIGGNGYLDITNILEKQESFLTIVGLPLNTAKYHISNVKVYNIAGQVASCDSYREIAVLQDKTYATARIPLLVDGGEAFQDTGSFQITVTVTTDIYTQLLITPDDFVVIPFIRGSAVLDLFSTFGLFDGELANPSDLAPPQIKEGSSFDINGTPYRLEQNLYIDSELPAVSGLLYIYASRESRESSEVSFEYSSQAPVFNKIKNGYYIGEKRALWKMLFYIDDEGDKFLFKTKMHEQFPQFESYVIKNDDPFVTSFRSVYSLAGKNDPAPVSVSLDPGLYIAQVSGAGGGPGSALAAAFTNSSIVLPAGGDGGIVTEIFSLNRKTSFTAFTGSGGKPGDYYLQYGSSVLGVVNSAYDDNPFPSVLPMTDNSPAYHFSTLYCFSGGAGGGGGSGSFLYSSQGYLLAAGGGGGGSGHSADTPGGGGGAGGSLGSGGGGGAPGYMYVQVVVSDDFRGQLSSYAFSNRGKGSGGSGGGYLGGAAGVLESSPHGKNGYSFLSSYGTGFSGLTSSASNYFSSTDSEQFTSIPFSLNISRSHYNSFSQSGDGGAAAVISASSFTNTNDSNGQGANANALPHSGSLSSNSSPTYAGNAGGHGGNNRNSIRGGGARGGKLFSVSGSSGSSPGDEGSITIYKIF